MIKKIAKLYNSIPGIVVLFVVLMPFFANMFVSNTELLDNRPLYSRPTELSKSFSKDYEAYYNDTFAYRSKMVKRYIKLQNKLKLDTGKFFYGLGDWMFLDSKKTNDNDSLADYKGEIRFSDEQLKTIWEGIEKAKAFYNAKGVKYFAVVAPNKENVYAEFMPMNWQGARVSDVSRIDLAIDYVNSKDKGLILNLKQMVMSEKKNYPFDLYYMTDTHWNAMGAYIGFMEIAKELNKMGVKIPLKRLDVAQVREIGKKTFDMNNSFKEMDFEVEYLPHIKPELVASEHGGKRLIYHTPNALTDKKLLIVRDSFAAGLLPYLTKVFKDVVSVQQSRGTHEEMAEFVAKYKPDIVIDEVVERKFPKFLNYSEYYK